jgi:hypothetical protein
VANAAMTTWHLQVKVRFHFRDAKVCKTKYDRVLLRERNFTDIQAPVPHDIHVYAAELIEFRCV